MPGIKKNSKIQIPVKSINEREFDKLLAGRLKMSSSANVTMPVVEDFLQSDNQCRAPKEWLLQIKERAQLNFKSSPVTHLPTGISFAKTANRSSVSQFSINLLYDIMIESGNSNFIITSTLRTPEDQARAMYQNIKAKGYKFNYKLYGANGDKVIKVAENAAKDKLSEKEIMAAMVKEMNKIGPGKVSKHAGDPNKINVIDIAPSSISNRKAFELAVEKRKIYMLKPPDDPAYHLEIAQPLDFITLP